MKPRTNPNAHSIGVSYVFLKREKRHRKVKNAIEEHREGNRKPVGFITKFNYDN